MFLRLADRYRNLRHTPLAGRMTRYALGSIVAATSSAITFGLLYVMNVDTTVCSIAAFVAGAIPNWILNRRWAWQRRGRPVFGREVVGYIGISLVSLVATSAATGWMDDHVGWIPPHHGLRAIAVTAAYMTVVAVLFVVKFWLYEYWVFSDRSRVRAAFRSLRQVPRTARANRMP
jgi:putative flippase GtrA